MKTSAKFTFVKNINKVLLFISLLSASVVSQAQVNLNNLNPYTQNFDDLPQSGAFADNSTIPGWYVALGGSKNIAGGDGSNTTAGIRSFGTNSDRSLGGVTNGTTGDIYYGIRFKNTSGTALTKLIVTYSLEEWRGLALLSGSFGSLKFSYRTGSSVTSLVSGTWTPVAALDLTGQAFGNWFSAAALDGNANKTVITATITLPVSLANNQEIMLRWQNPAVNSGNYLSIDDVSVTPITGNTNIYYNSYTTNWLGQVTINDVSNRLNWWTNNNGSGSNPADFSNGVFIFQGNSTHTLAHNLVLGANAKFIVSSGELIIPANRTLTGTVDVNDNATLTINNTVHPALGTLGDLSTVNINSNSNTIPNRQYGNLTVGNGKKNLNAALRVKKKLTLNSSLELGNYDLDLDEGAVIQNASDSRYIIAKGNGRLKMKVKNNNQEVVFPVGTDTEYLPIKIKQNAGAVTDVFSVKVIDGIYTAYNNNVPSGDPINEYAYGKTWIIDEEVIGGSDVTISLEVKTSLVGGLLNVVGALTGFDINEARIVHYENNQWDYSPGLPNVLNAISGGYTISRSGITSFSPYSMMSKTPTPLPVELVSFTAKREGNGIVSTWKTAQELNNDFFTVERSTNGVEFTEVGTVKGKGTTSQAAVYSFTDQFAPTAKTYYRLKQTDFDGAFEYSKIVVVTEGKPAAAAYELYPNPSAGQSVLQILTELNSPVVVTIFDAQGKVVKTLEADPLNLRTGLPLDLTAEPAGIYVVQIVADEQVSNLRMVKQ